MSSMTRANSSMACTLISGRKSTTTCRTPTSEGLQRRRDLLVGTTDRALVIREPAGLGQLDEGSDGQVDCRGVPPDFGTDGNHALPLLGGLGWVDGPDGDIAIGVSGDNPQH